MRMLCSLAAANNLELQSWDIALAFLDSPMHRDDGFMAPMQGFASGEPGEVYRLKNSVYGLRNASWLQYKRTCDAMRAEGFVQVQNDSCLWYKRDEKTGIFVICAIYVDDFLCVSNDPAALSTLQETLRRKHNLNFATTHGATDEPCYDLEYLGVKISRDRRKHQVTLSQGQLVADIVGDATAFTGEPIPMRLLPLPAKAKVNIRSTAMPLPPLQHSMYRQLLGKLLYVANWTRPELSHCTSELSRVLSAPTIEHWDLLLHVVGYLRRDPELGITYNRSGNEEMVNKLWAHSDASFACCPHTSKSMLGYALHLNGAAILWKSKRSDTVLDSTSAAEYSALGLCAKEVRTTMRALYEINYYQMSPPQIAILQCDSTSAISTTTSRPLALGTFRSNFMSSVNASIRAIFLFSM